MTADIESVARWQRDHRYLGSHHDRNAGRTRIVTALSTVTMVVEIVAGSVFGSLALLADGLHMAAHVVVLGAAAYAYSYARRHADTERYSFGTGKVGDLVGFASALVLSMVSLGMIFESVQRLISPETIIVREALVVAVLGFVVNLVSARLLWDREGQHGHAHAHHEDHDHGHHHTDHNLQAAYLHILTDVLTSVLAIVALLSVQFLHWNWMDPIVGIVGAGVIIHWSRNLMRQTARVLLDATSTTAHAVRRAVEAEGVSRVADLHVWRVGPGHLAAILTVVTRKPHPPAHYKRLLTHIPGLSHITVEVEEWTAESLGVDQDALIHDERHFFLTRMND